MGPVRAFATVMAVFSMTVARSVLANAQAALEPPPTEYSEPAAQFIGLDTGLTDSVHAEPESLTTPLPAPSEIHGRGFRTAVGITAINLLMWGFNRAYRNEDWTRVSPSTWWKAVSGGVKWDPNDALTNNFHHPYHGSMYFNVARANGFSFWAAAPITLAGSVLWEVMFEAQAPSTNDLVATSLMGVTLGEATRRLSLLVLDNQATGLDRVWREASVLLVDPGLGLNRLSLGQTWQRRANPVDRPAVKVASRVVAGARKLQPADADVAEGQVFVGVALEYGDPFSAAKVSPFSYFTFSLETATGSTSALSDIDARGLLAKFGARDTNHVAGVFMEYAFQQNPVYKFAFQSFGAGLLSRAGRGDWRFRSDVSAEVLPLVASSDPRAWAAVGRLYDYGAGVGARVLGQLQYRGAGVTASYRGYWTTTLNGGSRAHLNHFLSVEASAPLLARLSVGAAYQLYAQRSAYADGASLYDVRPSFSLFLSTSH